MVNTRIIVDWSQIASASAFYRPFLGSSEYSKFPVEFDLHEQPEL